MAEGFGRLNLIEANEELSRLSKPNGDSSEKYVALPNEGIVTVRFLPPAEGKDFFVVTRIHKLKIDGEKYPKNIHCTRVIRKVQGKKRWVDRDPKDPCPLCRYNDSLWDKIRAAEARGDLKMVEQIKKEASDVRANERYYYQVIVREEQNRKTGKTEFNVGPKVFSCGKMVHEMIYLAICGDESTGRQPLGDITDPRTGRDFRLVKKLKPGGEFPEYSKSFFLEPSPLGTEREMNEWFNGLHDLTRERRLVTHSEMELDLRRYLGEDVDSFDPQEFTRGLDEQIESGSTTTSTKSAVVRAAEMEMGGSGGDDESLSDEDFFKKIQNM